MKRKCVSDIKKELNADSVLLEVYSFEGGMIGKISEAQFEDDMALSLWQLKVRDYEYHLSKKDNTAVIIIHEQDNYKHICLIYRIIASWKRLKWEENGQ